MKNIEVKHTDIHNLLAFADDIEVRTDQVIDGVTYLGQDVIVNKQRIKQFKHQYCVNKTVNLLKDINDRLIDAGIDTDNVEVTDRKWAEGGVNSRTVTFNQPDTVIEPKKGDYIKAQMTILNSYDGSRKASICFGLMRLVCKNGMIALDKDTGVQSFKKHTNDNVFETEYNKIRLFKDSVDVFNTQLQTYANTVVDLKTVRNTLKNTIASSEVKENQIMEYVENNNRGSIDKIDLYSVYNGVTEWATHHEVRGNSEANNVYLSRQMDVTKLLQSQDFMQLVA